MLLTVIKACRGLRPASVVVSALLSLMLAANLAYAAPAGQVEFAQGLASAQQKGQTPRFLSKAAPRVAN